MLAVKLILLLLSTLASGDLRVLFFTMHGCPPCRQTEPNIQRLASDGVPVVTINARQQPQVAAQFQVFQTPTVILLDGDQQINRHSGPMTYADLRQLVDSASARKRPASNMRVAQPELNQQAPATQPMANVTAQQRPIQPVSASNLSPKDRAYQASVRLRVEDSKGVSYATGTIVHKHQNEALVVTCGHVFRESQGQGIIHTDLGFAYGQPQTVTGRLVHYDSESHDIALVAIRCNLPIVPVPIAPQSLAMQTGDRVFSLGCDRGQPPTMRQSAMKAVTRYSGVVKYDTVGRPVDGRSGGGLFSAGGQLIGVCNAAAVEVDEGIYAGLNSIYWQFEKTKLVHLFQPQNQIQNQQLVANSETPFAGNRNTAVVALNNQSSQGPTQSVATSQAQPIGRQPTSGAQAIRPAVSERQTRPPMTTVSQGSASNDLEVIMLVRSKTQPNQVETITISQPSTEVLQWIEATRQNASQRQQNFVARSRMMPDLTGKQVTENSEMRAQSPR